MKNHTVINNKYIMRFINFSVQRGQTDRTLKISHNLIILKSSES